MDIEAFIQKHGTQDRAAQALGFSQGFLSRLKTKARSLSIASALRVERDHGIDARCLVTAGDAELLPALATPTPAAFSGGGASGAIPSTTPAGETGV